MVKLEHRFKSLLEEEDRKAEELQTVEQARRKNNSGLKKLGFPPDTKWDVVKSYLYIYGGMFLLAGAVWFGGAILFAVVLVLYELAIGV
ncbi:hypothetical protein CN959_06570 [Bacillus cereus]|uniref:hypothetical protein n=1 Tax=Bacillus cereus group TaxID=86661 RepID=UPI000BFB8DC2|nr:MULTISPECIES: hypothetical protein [Bacillus cereus group]MEC3155440.1 hypothetical protein [Bacillus thuringiensis]PGM90225.1 hypothetical protein CN953_24060 [Bacillus thuringiensis]PGN09109.1 hypothetical protein CN959_06570 [Bacillus cereus]